MTKITPFSAARGARLPRGSRVFLKSRLARYPPNTTAASIQTVAPRLDLALAMARAIGRRVVSFGLVNIPVRVFTAVKDLSVHLSTLSKDGECCLPRKMVRPETDKEYAF